MPLPQTLRELIVSKGPRNSLSGSLNTYHPLSSADDLAAVIYKARISGLAGLCVWPVALSRLLMHLLNYW